MERGFEAVVGTGKGSVSCWRMYGWRSWNKSWKGESGLLISVEREWALVVMSSEDVEGRLRRRVNVSGSGSVYGGRGASEGSWRLLAVTVTLRAHSKRE
jgi:hypothetical protein